MRDGRSARVRLRGSAAARACVLTTLVVGLVAGPVGAQEGAPPPVELSPSTSLALADEPLSVSVLNNTGDSWTLEWSAVVVPSGESATNPLTVEGPDVLAPAGRAVGTLAAAPDAPDGAGYVQVVATSEDETVVIRRPLSTAPSGVTPAVTTWSGVSPGTFGLTGGDGSDPLPLKGSTCGADETEKVWITTGRSTATLDWVCEPAKDNAAITFVPAGDMAIGKYTGTLELDEKVSVTYLKTAPWWVPVIAILIGFFFAIAFRAWLDCWRPLGRALGRVGHVAQRLKDAQATFVSRAGKAEFRRYDITSGVERELASIGAGLRGLPPKWARHWYTRWIPWNPADRADDEEKLLERIAKLDALADAWPGVAGDLGVLRTRLDDNEAKGVEVLATRLTKAARGLLSPECGAESPEAADATDLVSKVPETATALALLPLVREVSDTIEGGLSADRRAGDVLAFYAARRAYRRAAGELARAESAEDVKESGVNGLIEEARTTLIGLGTQPPVAGMTHDILLFKAARDRLAEPALERVRALPDLVRRARASLLITRSVDWGWLLVALAIATWTGLAAQYVDKPWGLWQDWVVMVVWAFGATTVLAPVLTAVSNVAAGPPRGTAAEKAKIG